MHKADRRLAERAVAGDNRAAQAVADRFRDDFFNLFMWLTRDHNLAEDLAQAAFVRAWERLADFRGDSSLRTWAHRVAFSVLATHRRREATEARAFDRYADANASSPPDCPSEQVEMRLALVDALAQLPDGQRRAVVLCKLQGLTIAEAAAVLDEPPGTVGRRVADALKRLHSLLADWCGRPRSAANSQSIPHVSEVTPNVPQRSEPAGPE